MHREHRQHRESSDRDEYSGLRCGAALHAGLGRTALNGKYATDYETDFFAPDRNALFHVRPRKVIALASGNFVGSPTRWTF